MIVKDNSFSAVLLESKSATRKACGAVLFFIGEAGTRADDDGAGLTLVVGGAKDLALGVEASGEIAEEIPNARLYIYDQWGHGLYEEAKDFNRLVLDFLKE